MEALRLTNTIDLPKEDWLKIRRKGIGGSDIAAIAGLNPWKPPVAVYLEKLDEAPEQEDNEKIYWGRTLESVIAKEFKRKNGVKLQRVNAVLQHPKHTVLLANIDRLVLDKEKGNAVLEIKTTSAWNAKEWEEDVPDWVMVQLQHYLNVTGLQRGYVAALIGGNKYVQYEIERDDEVIAYLEQIALDFWQKVESRIPPEMDGSQASANLLGMLYPQSEPESSIELPEETQNLIAEYEAALDEEKAARERKEEIANKIKVQLGENEVGLAGERKVIWKTISSTRLDTKKLKKECPDIHQKYSYTSEYRRFQVK